MRDADRQNPFSRPIVSAPYLWLLVFFLAPFVMVLKISLSQTALAQPPYSPVLRHFRRMGGAGGIFRQLSFDLIDFCVRLDLPLLLSQEPGGRGDFDRASLAIGYPIAYGIARSPRSWQPLLVMAVVLPFWTSFLIRVYAWINILQRDGLLNDFLLRFILSIHPSHGCRPIPRSISASSIRICRSWCCRFTRRWKKLTRRCWKRQPILAAHAGKLSGWSHFRCRFPALRPVHCSASSQSSANT